MMSICFIQQFVAVVHEPDWWQGDFLITCPLYLMSSAGCPSDYFRRRSASCHMVTALSATHVSMRACACTTQTHTHTGEPHKGGIKQIDAHAEDLSS